MKNEISPVQVIVYEGIGAETWSNSDRMTVTATLLDQGYSVLRVTANPGPDSRMSASPQHPVIVLAQFTETTPVVFDPNSSVVIATRNTSGMSSADILQLVASVRDELSVGLNQPGGVGAWKPWFPVIDYDRCTNCM